MKRQSVILLSLVFVFGCFWCFVVPGFRRLREYRAEAFHSNPRSDLPIPSLGLAAERNDTNLMAAMLARGVPIDARNNYREQCTALHCAAFKGKIAAIAFLPSHGANINSVDRDNETPLHYAAENDQAEAVSYLIARGADINVRSSSENRTPLEVAVSFQRVKAARVLLEHGANADFDTLIDSTKSDMEWAPLASQARRDQWLKTIALLQEFKEKRHVQ